MVPESLTDRDRRLFDDIVVRVPVALKVIFRRLIETEAVEGRHGACTTGQEVTYGR